MLAPLLLTLVHAAPLSPHAEQAAEHRFDPPASYRVAPELSASAVRPQLRRRVYGYLPFWSGMDPNRLRWDALTDVIHFDVDLAANGSLVSDHGWLPAGEPSAPLVEIAHRHGARAHLAAFVPGGLRDLLASAGTRAQAIRVIVDLAKRGRADGVNIDFEPVAASQTELFTTFMREMDAALEAALPHAELSVAVHPDLWEYPGYDIPKLAQIADRLLIMEYNFHWSGSVEAGPNAPLFGGGHWRQWVAECIDPPRGYLAFAPAEKLVMGIPYWGYSWPTESATKVPSRTRGTGKSVLYKDAVVAVAKQGRRWDEESQTPWYSYSGENPRQVWFDDVESIGLKYDLVNARDLNGVMIWALGYDQGRTELADKIVEKLRVREAPDGGLPDAGAPDAGALPLDGGSDPLPDAGPREDAGAASPAPAPGAFDAGEAPEAAPTGEALEAAPSPAAGCSALGLGSGWLALGAVALNGLRRRRAA